MPFITSKAEQSSTPLTPSPVTSTTSNSELAVTITFGLAAVAGTAITLLQAHRLWRAFRHHRLQSVRAHGGTGTVVDSLDGQSHVDALLLGASSARDVELATVGTTSSTGTVTSGPAPGIPAANSVRPEQYPVEDQLGATPSNDGQDRNGTSP
ncbi:MAG: hypothetical protein Q9221_007541 [Calogaya cf. arnoldii]